MNRAAWLAALAVAVLIGVAVGWLARGDRVVTRSAPVAQSSLIPAGTEPTDIRVLHGTNQIAVAWQRNAEGYPAEFGLTIWQRRSKGSG